MTQPDDAALRVARQIAEQTVDRGWNIEWAAALIRTLLTEREQELTRRGRELVDETRELKEALRKLRNEVLGVLGIAKEEHLCRYFGLDPDEQVGR